MSAKKKSHSKLLAPAVMGALGLALVVTALSLGKSDQKSLAPEAVEEASAETKIESPVNRFFGQRSAVLKTSQERQAEKNQNAVKSTLVPLSVRWKQSTVRLKYLDSCVKSQACEGFSQATPYSYGLETRLAMAREIHDFAQIANEWKQERGGKFPEEAQVLARYFMVTGNDDVKEAALKLMDLAETNPQNLKALVDGLVATGSAPLMERAMKKTLLRYAKTPEVDRMLIEQAKSGASQVQTVIAEHCLDYLSPRNLVAFKSIAAKTHPRSLARVYYRANFAEDARLRNGG